MKYVEREREGEREIFLEESKECTGYEKLQKRDRERDRERERVRERQGEIERERTTAPPSLLHRISPPLQYEKSLRFDYEQI